MFENILYRWVPKLVWPGGAMEINDLVCPTRPRMHRYLKRKIGNILCGFIYDN